MTFDAHTRPIIQAIDISTIGDNVLVAGEEGEIIYVHQIMLHAAAAVDITLQEEGPRNLSIIPLPEGAGIVLENTAPDVPFLFQVNPGLDLIANLSAGVAVKGHIVYSKRK